MIVLRKTNEVSDEHLNELFITALEGGSNYWYELPDEAVAILRQYKTDGKTLTEAVLPAIQDGKVIPVHDLEDPEKKLGVISMPYVRRGLQSAQDDDRVEIERLLEGNYDAFDADVLFQYIVMNKIVFG